MEIGLIGAGHPHAELHGKTLMRSDRVHGISIYAEDIETAHELRRVLKGPVRVFDSVDELLDTVSLSAAIVCMRNDQNASMCQRILSRGVPVLSEKPIGATPAEVLAVVDCARNLSLPLGVLYPNRFHPATQQARELIEAGILGTLTSCEGRLLTSQVQFRDPDHWIFSKSKSGGGILHWLGCHFFDLFEYVSGLEMESVSGRVGTLGEDSVDVEDVAVVLMQFREGALGSFQAGYELPLSSEGFIYPRYDAYLSFRGTLGRLWWDPTENPTELHVESRHSDWVSEPAKKFRIELPDVDVYGGAHGLLFLNQFLDAVQEGCQIPADGRDALRVSRIIDSVYHSSSCGEWVSLMERWTGGN